MEDKILYYSEGFSSQNVEKMGEDLFVKCINCKDHKELTYNSVVGDYYCQSCGTWQRG